MGKYVGVERRVKTDQSEKWRTSRIYLMEEILSGRDRKVFSSWED